MISIESDPFVLITKIEGVNTMVGSRIVVALSLSLLSGCIFAAEPVKLSSTLDELHFVLSHAMETEAPLSGGASLALNDSGEEDVERFLTLSANKPDNIEKDIFLGGRFKYIQAYYPGFFTVYKIGNKPDKWNGLLYSAGFTVRRPGQEVEPEASAAYKAIKRMHGRHSSIVKFMNRSRTHKDLVNYIWRLDDVVILYRSFHDLKQDDNVAVVVYWDRTFFDSHNYRNY